MKKKILTLLLLSTVSFSQEETITNKVDDKLIIKNKEEELSKLSLFLGKKERSTKVKSYNPSSNRYTRESDLSVEDYQKVSLMDVVLETVSTSSLLKASREKVIQSEIKLKDALAGYYPTLNFEYEVGRTQATNVGGDKNFKYFNDRNYKFILNQNLYAGGETQNTIKNLKKKLDLQKNQYYLVLSEQVTKAIKAYFDVVFSHRTVLTAEENMKKLNRILEIVTIKYDNGAASIGDLTAIKANVSNAQTQLIKVKSKFIEALRYYEYIAGEVYSETLPYEKNFNINVSTFDLLYERALKRNKDLVNYYESIAAEKFNLKSKESNFIPKIDFELSVDNVMDKEDYEQREQALNGLVKLSYNLYNGGKDKNKLLNSYSAIRELNFQLEEEKRKLKWNVSKLFTAIKSTNESLKSNISEVISLRKMVEAYWEEFKLGEQDLQVLLQGQKQLNSAEIELITYEKSSITDFFTLLKYTGDLLAFFDIDPEHPKFIDFSKSSYTQEIYIDDKFLNEKEKIERNEELEAEEKEKEVLISKALQEENIISFSSKILAADDNSYTIDFSLFKNLKEANSFIKSNKIDENSFAYDVVNDLSINSKVNYGIFKNKDKASKELEKLKTQFPSKDLSIKRIKEVKKLYNDYLNGLKVEVKPVPAEIKIVEKIRTIEKIKQEKKEEEFKLSEEFKNKFLNASGEYFTINITSLNSHKELENILIENINLYDNSFAYDYLDSTRLVRWIYGIYTTYDEASKALMELGDIKKTYYPVIQKISNEQMLYSNNIGLNTKIDLSKKEYEYVNVSSKTEYKNPVSLKDIDLSKDKQLESKVKDLLPKEETLELEKQKENVKEKNIDTEETIQIDDEKKINDLQNTNLENNSDFHSKFLNASSDFFTINLMTFYSNENVLEYLEKYNLKDESFYFKLGENLDSTNVVYGLYETKEQALKAIEKLPEIIVKINRPYIEKVGGKQNLYKQYNTSLSKKNEIETIKSTVEEIKAVEELINSSSPSDFITIDSYNDQDFKFEFLNSPRDYYSITLATIKNEAELKYFTQLYNLQKEIFVFRLGNNDEKIKIMYGIYEDEFAAQKAMESLPESMIKVNQPKAEKIYRKQEAYRLYHEKSELTVDSKGK